MRIFPVFLVLFFAFFQQLSAINENPIIFGNARFTVITPELIRMEYAQEGQFVDNKSMFAVNREQRTDSFKLYQEGKYQVIETKRMKLYYVPDNLPFSQMNIKITVYNQPENYEWRIYSVDDKNLGGTLSTLDEIAGEVPTENGLLSRNGWQVIDDSGKEIFVNNWIAERPVSHLKDLYFFAYGTDYKSALQSLTAISGAVPMNRKYVHGSWYCRWWNYTDDDYRQIVQEYKDHDFPLDILVMDMGWHTQKEATTGMGHAGMYGWTGYTWNKKLIPQPEALLKEFKDDNIIVTLNDHPADGIRHHEEKYSEFMAAMGEDTVGQKELIFNPGSKKYMDNFFKYALKPSEDKGVAFWWLDWQQDYLFPKVLGYRNLKNLQWLNYLYFNHSEQDNLRGLLFSRWAGWGSHRTPIQFSGDALASWDMLRFQVPFTASSSNVGCFYWAHDVGGFYGGRDIELYVRWTQFALTTSSLRIHSVYDANLDRRPWLWGDTAEVALRRVYHLRSQLMPYIYSSVRQGHTQSLPLNRSMYIDYPENEASYENPQQFMFGDLLLSAPIVSPGEGENFVSKQKVWFPEGNDWYNIFNHKRVKGGQTLEVTCDIYEFPLFVKAGVPMPMQSYKDRMSSAVLDTLVVRCYPCAVGKTGSYELYDDDGVSNDYLEGHYTVTKLSYAQLDKKAIITIGKAIGKSYKGQVDKRAYRIEIPNEKLKKISYRNRSLKIKTDVETGLSYVQIPKTSIDKELTLTISYK